MLLADGKNSGICLGINQRHIQRDRRPSTELKKFTVRKKIFCTWPRLKKNLMYRHDKTTEPAKTEEKISCIRHDKHNEPTKERPFSFVHFESLFTSVSTVSRGHPSLVSLEKNNKNARG
jgi:hypothetical protein